MINLIFMNSLDLITRDSKILVDSARDCISGNLIKAVQSGDVSLNEDQIKSIISIINLSSTEGYQRALTVFQNTIKKHIGT